MRKVSMLLAIPALSLAFAGPAFSLDVRAGFSIGYKDFKRDGFSLRTPYSWTEDSQTPKTTPNVALVVDGTTPNEAVVVNKPAKVAFSPEAFLVHQKPEVHPTMVTVNGNKAVREQYDAAFGNKPYRITQYYIFHGTRALVVNLRCTVADFAAQAPTLEKVADSIVFQ